MSINIEKRPLSYSLPVAVKILEKLSFDYNVPEVFNVIGAPTLNQLRNLWIKNSDIRKKFNSTQVINIEKNIEIIKI